uniref:Ig-like domain-containing protein n=1 Tax=Scleropages formosus TaxID=113540 RepID=A0A8C9QUI5_SCLFO
FINYFLYFTLDRTWSDEIYQPSSFLAVHLGDTATLECFFSKDERYISWFKQTAAEKPHIIAFTEKYLEPVFYNEFNTSKRFKIQRRDRSNHLMISKTEHSDSAVYYCGRMKDFIMLFGTGTFLSVKVIKVQCVILFHLYQSALPHPVPVLATNTNLDSSHIVRNRSSQEGSRQTRA